MVFFLARAMIGFKLSSLVDTMGIVFGPTYPLQMRPHLVRRPTFRLPAVEITALCPRVHHEVDGAASSKCTSAWHNWFSVSKLRCLVPLVEQRRLCCWLEILQIEYWIDDMWYILVVGAAFDNEDAEVWRGFGDASGDDTACCSTFIDCLVRIYSWLGAYLSIPPAMMMSTSSMSSASLL